MQGHRKPGVAEIRTSYLDRLKQAGVRRDWDTAKELLEEVLARDDARSVVNVYIYGVVLNVAARSGNWEEAVELL